MCYYENGLAASLRRIAYWIIRDIQVGHCFRQYANSFTYWLQVGLDPSVVYNSSSKRQDHEALKRPELFSPPFRSTRDVVSALKLQHTSTQHLGSDSKQDVSFCTDSRRDKLHIDVRLVAHSYSKTFYGTIYDIPTEEKPYSHPISALSQAAFTVCADSLDPAVFVRASPPLLPSCFSRVARALLPHSIPAISALRLVRFVTSSSHWTNVAKCLSKVSSSEGSDAGVRLLFLRSRRDFFLCVPGAVVVAQGEVDAAKVEDGAVEALVESPWTLKDEESDMTEEGG